VWLGVGSIKAAFSRPAHQRVTQAVSPPKEFIVMKKILISIPFIVLIVLSMLLLVENTELILGAFGIVQFSFIDPATELFGTLCFPIGPVLLITYWYARWAAKNQVNVNLVGSWTLLIFGIILALLYMPDPLLDSFFPEQYRIGRTILSVGLACLGIFGLIYSRFRKSKTIQVQDSATDKL